MTLKRSFQLVTTQRLDQDCRLQGLDAFLVANGAEDLVSKIVVLAEKLDKGTANILINRHPKLVLIPCEDRPDFAALVAAMIEHGDPAAISIVINADIWLDLGRSDVDSLLNAFNTSPDVAFTLTRRHDTDPEKLLSVDGFWMEMASSDAWIFSGLPRKFILNGVQLGSQDLECLVDEGLRLSGYSLANACLWIRAIHLEETINDYGQFNLDRLYEVLLENPLLAASGIPSARVILPPAFGAYSGSYPLYPQRYAYKWEHFRSRWLLIDLRNRELSECQSSLAWLLFLARSHDRFILACVNDATDVDILALLDRFHGLTGRSLCLNDFAIERLISQDLVADLCWVSSPAIIGKNLLKQSIPIVCLDCCEKQPIKASWLSEHGINSVATELKAMQLFDPACIDEIISEQSLNWFHMQLVSCVFKSEDYIENFLQHSTWWISTAAVYGHKVLHSFCDVKPDLPQRRRMVRALKGRPGFLIQLAEDPGLYGSWNILIEASEEEFIGNANPDDCRSADHLVLLLDQLRGKPNVMVGSTAVLPIYQKQQLNLAYEDLVEDLERREEAAWFSDIPDGYGLESLYSSREENDSEPEPQNIPHCSPVWRRKIHQLYGLFDEEKYGSEADWALWCAYAFDGGRFCHIQEPLSGYFVNPNSYGRSQSRSVGYQRIVAGYLKPSVPVPPRSFAATSINSTRQLNKCPESTPKINIHGLTADYGEHRFANNQILNSILDLHDPSADSDFIWFLERFFLWGDLPGERKSPQFSAIKKPWIGVLHVPPLTPRWIGNQFAELYFLPEWKKSIESCRTLICLSAYMARDLKLLYPSIPVYHVPHPVQPFPVRFSVDKFLATPQVVLVGNWLRRHHRFYCWDSPVAKLHIFKRDTQELLDHEWIEYGKPGDKQLSSVTKIGFLPPAEYDALLSSSLIYLSLYETSGNNAVTECIAMGTPFIADRHPALEEYVGHDYPFFVAEGELESLSKDQLLERAIAAADYLSANKQFLRRLSYNGFRRRLISILKSV